MEVILRCTEGSSNKQYRISLEEKGGLYSVHCYNRRVGNPWVDQGSKVAGVSFATAQAEGRKIEAAKIKKGYYHESGGLTGSPSTVAKPAATPAISGPAPTIKSVPVTNPDPIEDFAAKVEEAKNPGLNRPQLLNVIEEATAQTLAADPSFVAQEKMDGVRQMVFGREVENGDEIVLVLGASNKLGNQIPGESKVLAAFEGIQLPFTVDGELVGETFYAFDLLDWNGSDLREMPYSIRYASLQTFLPQHPNVVLVPSVQGDETIIATMKAKGAEGVVFKRSSAKFKAGRPNSGGDQFKFKFTSSASCIVQGQNGSKRSVSLTLLDGSSVVGVGSCTIPANQEIPADGAIVEIRYLYAYRGGSLFQPCYLGVRNDILATECQMSQLRFKGEGEDE